MQQPALVSATRRLVERLDSLTPPAPVTHAYNPLSYAWAPHAEYLRRFGAAAREVVLVGMNPGPWGMVQTGVPFGDVGMVRDWMGISGEVGQPGSVHPKRPVQGFACARGEVSGRRLWGWARQRFGTPERFFARFFVANYCPLAFFDVNGTNVTPDKLPKGYRTEVQQCCDDAVMEIVSLMKPRHIIGIGLYVETRLRSLLGDRAAPIVGRITHPSPANPAANRGWVALVEQELAQMGVEMPPASSSAAPIGGAR